MRHFRRVPHVFCCAGPRPILDKPISFDTACPSRHRRRKHPSRSGETAMSWASGTSFDPPGAAILHGSSQGASPTGTSPADDVSARKRKRSSISSLPNGEEAGDGSPTRSRHQPGVKRACNDCRQQKVRSTCACSSSRSCVVKLVGLVMAPLRVQA